MQRNASGPAVDASTGVLGREIIDRPVLATVVSIFLLLLGLLALQRLPRAQYPAIAPPEVNVTVEYTGANAETVTKAAIMPLERAINGVPGMKFMSSDAGNDGVGVIQVLFEVGTDPDVAAINVQNRVASVSGELPPEIVRNGVKIAKEENAMLMFLAIYSEDPEVDEKFLYNFADINLLAELKRIPGVGYIDIVGAKEYAMRIWIDPERLAALRLEASDVLEAIQAQSLEAAPGKLGENSDRATNQRQYVIRHKGKFSSEEQFKSIPVRTLEDGSVLRLEEVADVEFSTTYFDVEARLNGRPAATLLLKQLPGSNANQVIGAVKERLKTLAQERFLPGMHYEITYDVARILEASIDQVVRTLAEAFILVALVTFLFLKSWRATLIAIAAIPVSLVGSLMFVKLLGYSLNLITLFAIILAIGIVVDNAIVVVEAIEAELAASGVDARTGSKRAMGQIRGAIVSITLVMSAVFVPIAFASGPTGIFMKQFCLTMAAAIVLSGVIALTLTPALCARYLQPHAPSGGSPGPLMRGLNAFDRFFRTTERGYLQALKRFLGRPAVLVALFLVCTSGAGLVMGSLPTGFIPQEDAGVFYASVTTPPGSTLERTKEVVDRIQSLTADVPGILTTTTLAGTNVLSDGTGATYGTVQFGLADWSQRAPIETIIDRVAERIESIKSAEIELFPPPSVPGYGNSSGFELRVLDKTGSGDLGQLQEVIDEFLIALRKRPEIAAAFTMFEASFPQYTIDIDQSRASRYGVSVEDVMQELQILLGGEYAVNFIRFGRMYKVMLQALPKFRRTPEDLLNLRVRNAAGEFVALSEIAGLEKTYGADQVTRYNMFASAEVTGLPAPGFSSGEALKAVQAVAATSLPPGFGIDWAGMAKDELEAGNEGLVLIGICLVFVYLLLAAQYESFLLPLPVILALPAGLLGAGLGLAAFGLENNIYARASILMLIGLLGKNAILIIEYASQGQRRGLGKREAILAAAEARFRAIVMTSAALVAGLIPLLFSSGVGAIGNRTVGSSAVGGMVVGTLLGLFLVPGLFMLCARGAVERRKETQSRHAEAHGELGVGVSA